MRRAMVKIVLIVLFCAGLVMTMSLCHAARRGDEQLQPMDMGVTTTRTFCRYPVPLSDDLQQHIITTAMAKGVSPALVMAIIQRESNCNPDMIGDDGNSFGLMQIYANQHTERCVRLNAVNLLDPYKNIEVGVDILAELMSHNKSLPWVLMAYNGGMSYAGQMTAEGNVSNYAKQVMALSEQIAEGVMVVTAE